MSNFTRHTDRYCAKCLSKLGDKVVVDFYGNEFCSDSCRRYWWDEKRQDMDDIASEWRDM